MHIVMWGREGGYGPDYPRNRVVLAAMQALGHSVSLFKPKLSISADWEYALRRLPKPDLIWVPCFRQRDVAAAARYAKRHAVPLIFDPLISAYDKQVNEKQKFGADTATAKRLLRWEQQRFAMADVLIADTEGHAQYFSEQLGFPRERIVVVPVGAEESLFVPTPLPARSADEPLQLVFFGTFIGLQGVEVLVEAIGRYDGPPVHWSLLGEGPLKGHCEQRIAHLNAERAQRGLPTLPVQFEGWRKLAELPARLQQADAFLGIFGAGDKSRRVIPNKVYQGLALARPVITAATPAYPSALLRDEQQGLFWCEPGDADSLAAAVQRFALQRAAIAHLAATARESYERFFSQRVISATVAKALSLAKTVAQLP